MNSGDLNHFVSGMLGGFTSTLVVHPLDLLKLRFAVNEGYKEFRPEYSGYRSAIKEIVRVHGFRGLYQGATPNLLGSTVAWGLYLHFYDLTKSLLSRCFSLPKESLSMGHNLISGCLAGTLTLAVTNPIWVVKTRLCLQYENNNSKYKGMMDALVKTFREEGIRGWYRGFGAGIIGTSHGAVQLATYEWLKNRYCNKSGKAHSEKLSSWLYISFAALSKTVAVVSTYPYQVVRARLQDHHTNYSGIGAVVIETWRGERIVGFYKGLIPSLVRVLPAICITFVVYENSIHFLKDRSFG